MSAFGSVCEFVVAEIPIGGPPTTIIVPADAWTWSDNALRISAGASARITADVLTETEPAPRISSGVRIGPAADAMVLSNGAPMVSISATIKIIADTWTWADLQPRASGGASVHIADNFTAASDSGSVAQGAVGEFAVAEGGIVNYPVSHVDSLLMNEALPRISTGKSEFIPADALVLNDRIVEIGSRSRKLRIIAIAS